MKTLTVAAILALALTATARAETHRFKVPAHSVVTWKLDGRYATDVELYPTSARREPTSIYQRGKCPGPSDVVDTLGWTFRNGVLLEATQRDCEPGPIRLRASNLRGRARWIRLRIVSPITG